MPSTTIKFCRNIQYHHSPTSGGHYDPTYNFDSSLHPSLKLIWSYKFIKFVILVGFIDQLMKYIIQPSYEFRGAMMIIEIQKFFGLIANKSGTFSFWFPFKFWVSKKMQQKPLFSCRSNLHLIYGTGCCNNNELVVESP